MSPLLLVCVLLAAEVYPLRVQDDDFHEPLTRLAPLKERDEEARFRIVAEAHYAHGRLLLQRRDLSAALQRFQRAWRYHPQGELILPRIVLLAQQLRRSDEAARYALLADHPSDLGAPLLRQLAIQLSARQESELALTLFEASLPAEARSAARRDDPPDARPGEADEDLAALLVYLEMGRLALVIEDYSKSADYFARVKEALENPGRLMQNEAVQQTLLGQADRSYRLMAEAFFLAERYDSAEAMARRAYPQPSGQDRPPLLDYHLARIAAKREQTEQALQYLESYFAASATAADSAPYALLAELYQRAEADPAAADRRLRERLEDLLQADARNTALISYLAELDLSAERLDAAEERFEQLLVLQQAANVYQGLADIYARQNRPDKLAELCGILVAKSGSFSDLELLLEQLVEHAAMRSGLIGVVQRQQQDPDQEVPAGALVAAAMLSEADSDSSAADAPANDAPLADVLFAEGLSRLESEAQAEYLLAWGLKLLLDGTRERAVSVFRQALEKELPDSRKAACYYYLTRALALSEDIDAALEVAEEAARAFPDAPRLQVQPGWVLYVAKRYDEAERSYRALLERFDSLPSNDVRETMRDVRHMLSNVSFRQDRMAEAEEWLEQVLDEFPEDLGALNDLGYLWADDGRNLNRALEMTRRAVAGRPDSAAFRDSLGWALYRLGRICEAVRELEQAASGDDPDGVILDHLGDAYLRADRQAEALATWRRAAEAFAKQGDLEKQQTTEEKIKRHKR